MEIRSNEVLSGRQSADSDQLSSIRLLGDLILVLADSRETMPDGLIAPAEAQHMDEALRHQAPRQGVVLRIGPGRDTGKSHRPGLWKPADPQMQCKPGDRIVFPDWCGAPVPGDPVPAAGDPQRLVMHDTEVWGVLEV
jgi:hypothetical protein